MNKKMREIKAQIEVLNEEATKLFEAKDLEGAESKINEIDNLEREYKVAERLFKSEKDEVTDEAVAKTKAYDKVKNFADGIRMAIQNKMSEGSNVDGGYTVPEDIITDVEKLRDAEFSLEQLVSVEPVTTMSGRRTFKKRSQQTGFTKVGEGGKVGKKATPQYAVMNYTIEKYAGYYPITNELLEDSDANIYNDLVTWIAGDSRATRNNLILEAINTKSAVAIAGLDGIKRVLNVTLGQAFKPTSVIVTNDDGLQYLDTLKDADEKYVLSNSPADPMKLVLSAGATTIPVKVVPNKVLTTTDNKVPFIIGDLKEGIKLFDRRKLNILASNVAVVGSGDEMLNAYEEDLTLLRGIEREDVEVRDAEAFVNGYIEVTQATA